MNKTQFRENAQKTFRDSSQIKKWVLTWCAALMLVSGTHVSAATLQARKYSISLNKIPLTEAIKEVEKTTNFVFFYNNAQIKTNQLVSVKIKDGSLEDILRQMLPNTPYKIENGKIILLDASATSNKKTRDINGVILDEAGETIIGASVIVKGASVGTATDFDGKFTLKASEGDEIQISYIGYNTKTFKVTNAATYSIKLSENTKILDEVVVVGYGVEKKVNVIGSIAQVTAEKLENRSTPLLSNALTGQMSGVTVIQRSGQPGASGGAIQVRGVGSITAGSSALVLIDGIPGSLNDVSAEDVESISVLKDASTAAIYGARAANGVILVTTKTGKEGKIKVSYSGYVGFNQATELPKFVNSWDWASLYNEAIGREVYTADDIRMMQDGSNPDKYTNENYLKKMLDNKGFQTGHDITLNGGNRENKYMISLGYLSQDGIVEKNNYSRYNARINVINELHPTLKLTTRIAGTYSKRNEPNSPGGDDATGMTGIVQKAVRFPGLYPTQMSDGSWGPGPENHGTPIGWIKSPSFYRSPKFNVNANMRLDYNPIKDLNIAAIGAVSYDNNEERAYKASLNLAGGRTLGPSSYRNMMGKNIYKSFQATVDYNKSLGKHNMGALIGYSWEDKQLRTLEATRDKYPGNDLSEINAGSPDNQKNSGTTNKWAMQSVFGRLKYNFSERYLFEATMRYDGSSRFPKNKRYAFFPSAAVGWRLSEESFIRENERLGWISNLKLKASIGKLGNESLGGTYYPHQTTYNLGQNYPFGDNLNLGAAVTTLVDPNLKWEETRSIDGGFEALFWNGLLGINVTYFNKRTKDLLYKPGQSISGVLGMDVGVKNMGELENSGWEFEFSHNNKIGDFSYNVGVNFSIIKNKVITLGLGDVQQLNGLVGDGTQFVGHPLELYYGYLTDGVFLNDGEVVDWADQTKVNAGSKAGDIRYLDISGPNGVPDGKVTPEYDRVPLGSRIPKYIYGINLGGEYKGVDFSVLFQGTGGVKGMLNGYAGYALFSNNGNIQKWQAESRFDPQNPQRNPGYPRLEILSNNGSPNTASSDYWVRDASYLRIKNIQVGYTLPKSISNKLRLSNLRFYVQAENPVTWHNYPKGWDPEINTGGIYYPILKTYTFGLNIKF